MHDGSVVGFGPITDVQIAAGFRVAAEVGNGWIVVLCPPFTFNTSSIRNLQRFLGVLRLLPE